MARILFFIPYETMIEQAREVLAADFPDIEIALASPRDAVSVVRERRRHGIEIVAARAVTARAIQQAALNVTVVTIPITAFDIIRAINEAKAKGKKIAVVAHSAMVLGIELLAKELNVAIRHYAMSHGDDYEKTTLAAIADGAEVIIGGALAVTAATRHGIPCALIKFGSESLLQAALEAVRIQAALEAESAKHGFLRTILDHTRDGMITVDSGHKITAINPVALRIAHTDKTAAMGQPLAAVLPQLPVGKAESPHSLLTINGARVIANSVPILVNGKSFGSVITLQESSKIQQMEAMIRKEIYASGHYAKYSFSDVIGTGPKITKTKETAADYAAADSSILILGESGTGKELFAQSIHNASRRANNPFVAINCAALPAQILESELFGYVGGAFTGASKEGKPGLFEVAHGGTLFLDEVTEMDYTNQGRLLRVLQEKAVVRLGSYKVMPVDVRIIAATNKEPELLVRQNAFRLDLFYRLNVLRLDIPPLRERQADIALYAELFLQQFGDSLGKRLRLSREALFYLQQYPWPGNIRELRNLMERLAVICKTETVSAALISELAKPGFTAEKPLPSAKAIRMKEEILNALTTAGGNYTLAAAALNINRSTLWRRMKRLEIDY
ncbi:MAG: sigma 54-interacting transcriptional regulator [Sporomusaceae bacterium]|nr:sigma 54-interacting transcriptional regulator [Sporomusaceae bacterium]